jgi:hypothetical protein
MTGDELPQSSRPLRMEERELLEALIGAARSGATRYLGQLERAVVLESCRCGCPSIDLVISGNARGRPKPLVMADGESPEGVPVGIILWTCDGELSSLEIHPWDGTDHVRLPAPESLGNVRFLPK